MRRIILLLVISCIACINYTHAAIVEEISTKVSDAQCTGANINDEFYISGQNYTTFLIDEIWSSTDRYIAISTSKISYWESDANLISGCRTSSDWYRQSEVAPGNNTKVVAFGANCTFNKPTDPNKRTVQFVYNIKHGAVTQNGSASATKHYSIYNNGTWTTHSKSYPNYWVQDYEIHENECYNVELKYCGDGVVDTTYGETCDPAAPGYDETTCSVNTCTPISYDLALRKTTATAGPFNIGDSVTFNIEVFNQGTIDANNIEVTDYIPTGLTLNDTNWTQSGSTAVRAITSLTAGQSTTLPITFTINNQASGSITNYAEISEDDGDDCDSTPDNDNTNDGTPVDDAIGTACEPGGDEDDHDPETIVLGGGYDLALAKKLSNATPGPFSIGDGVTFNIEVTNQGTIDANDIEVTDYIPTGLTLNDSAWTQSGSTAVRTIASVTAGNTVTVSISFTINNQATGTIINYAEISEDDGDDCDSTPDNDNTNDGTPVDDAIGTACEPGGDEDDHDPEEITVNDVPACTSLTASPTSGTAPVNSTVVCTGENVTSFKIECGNGASFTGVGSNNGTETFSKVCSYTSVGTYTPKCYVNDTISNTSCQKTVTVTNSSSSSSSGGGRVNTCFSVERNGDNVTCVGDSQTKQFRVSCGNGTDYKYVNASDLTNSTRKTGTVDCEYSEEGKEKVSTAICYVATRLTGTPAWRTRLQCQLGESNFCGDGIIQRPNDNGQNEECERVVNSDGSLGDFPSNCTSGCKFKGTGSSSGGSSSGGGIITIPGQGDIVFGPIGTVVVGHGKNPLVENGENPFIRNDSEYDLYFDELCTSVTSGSSLNGTATQCTPINDIIYPGEKVTLDPYPVYTGNKDAVPAGQSYGSNTITTTIRTDGELYDWAYFAANLAARVSKPSIATTGGGTSYVKDTSKIADVNQVAVTNQDENKNFVGTSVSEGDLSSYSSEVTDSSSVSEVADSGEVSQSVEKVEDAIITTSQVTSLTDSSIKNYNGLANVYILNGTDLRIDSIPSYLTGPRTYIIQNADLIINGNLDYSDNIAFVVKGGDIKINENVTEIVGTYISIPASGSGGAIEGIGGNTDNILTVKGSLYGDVTNLVDKRTYISNDTNTGQINVGTIVSFGSQIFKKPAPLVGQFISEYLSSEKVAQ